MLDLLYEKSRSEVHVQSVIIRAVLIIEQLQVFFCYLKRFSIRPVSFGGFANIIHRDVFRI